MNDFFIANVTVTNQWMILQMPEHNIAISFN